ncbi:hypothetical protein PIB30_067331 [Stylosanthes scabra]|uniref:Uncharacterized protein n=1 Tax=Stylosanthes scabra TaxID=79078 RepID=A0ABU6VM57_9FABA|nr:hypothetical protein [Stylosanthes scabra]
MSSSGLFSLSVFSWYTSTNITRFSKTNKHITEEANREEPKAVLDGVAVAGLVGILRQLGDLAEIGEVHVLLAYKGAGWDCNPSRMTSPSLVKDPYEDNKHYAMIIPPRDLVRTSEDGELESRQPLFGEQDDNLTSLAIPSDDGELLLERPELIPTVIEVGPQIETAQEHEADFTEESDTNEPS